ncbi:MAG TPA: monooxygenase [Alphaproteobacteria bacterium]|nr:monooxygenase [Alphaproteobacteria bacterium]
MTKNQKVCIIGAGCSGFTTAKALKDRGIAFDCFEMTDQIGGTWAFEAKNSRSACYRSLHIDTSKYRLAFKDYPIPAHYPDYPHHTELLAYFNAYVDHFGLRPMITFNTEVKQCERRADGTWRVALSTGEVRDYSALFVCNGHHWDPHTPAFPGTFAGTQFHSHAYVDPFDPVDARGKRVLVVGMGNSAMDIASELSQRPIAEKLFVVARRGVWIFPKYIKGKVPDKGAMPLWMPRWLMRFLVKRMVHGAIGRMSDYGLPEPEHHPADQHPSVSGEFLTRVGCGDIKIKPAIARFDGSVVHFEDGSSEPIDIIVYATGYNISFPFLDPGLIPVIDNHLPLFKRIWKPGIDNLFFMGLAQPLPTLVNLAEVQAKWVAAYLSGDYVLPSQAEMEATIARDEARDIGRYYKSRRHTMQINFDLYCHEIAQEQKRGAVRARMHKAA